MDCCCDCWPPPETIPLPLVVVAAVDTPTSTTVGVGAGEEAVSGISGTVDDDDVEASPPECSSGRQAMLLTEEFGVEEGTRRPFWQEVMSSCEKVPKGQTFVTCGIAQDTSKHLPTFDNLQTWRRLARKDLAWPRGCRRRGC